MKGKFKVCAALLASTLLLSGCAPVTSEYTANEIADMKAGEIHGDKQLEKTNDIEMTDEEMRAYVYSYVSGSARIDMDKLNMPSPKEQTKITEHIGKIIYQM